MKHQSRASIFLIILFLAFYVSTAAAQGQLSGSTAVQANLRAGPSRNQKILFSLPPHTDIVIEARNAGADWLLVQASESRRGWLTARQVSFKTTPDLKALPVSDQIIGQQAAAATTPPPPAKAANAAPPEANSPSLDALLANPSSYAARITPGVRRAMKAVYQRGLKLGNNPRVFAKVGDCWSSEYWALPQFGDGHGYDLGKFSYLSSVIHYYSVSPREGVANSFINRSQSTHAGMHLGAVFDPIWADPKLCKPNETPLACEFRINKPSVLVEMMGVTDIVFFSVGEFERLMQRLVKESLAQGVVPILSTAPNPPGPFHDKRTKFNQITRGIATANSLPLIELEAATDLLPDHGVDPDGVHPTPYAAFTRVAFHPERFREGAVLWDFLALQSLYNVWQTVVN